MLKSVALGLGLVIAVSSFVPAESRERVRLRVIDPRLDYVLVPDEPVRPSAAAEGYDLALERSQIAVAPSEAAAIARDMLPGAKVVGVRLLPSGYYAVTLRRKGSVTRVLVSAMDGSVR